MILLVCQITGKDIFLISRAIASRFEALRYEVVRALPVFLLADQTILPIINPCHPSGSGTGGKGPGAPRMRPSVAVDFVQSNQAGKYLTYGN